MNQVMLEKKEKLLEEQLEAVKAQRTAPARYIAYCEKNGTALNMERRTPMRDIIALAKEAGFLSRVAFSFKTEFEALSALLEAEIRKEFEVSIQYWKDDSAAAWDKCEERRQENLALTAQNAKLMEALEKYKSANSLLRPVNLTVSKCYCKPGLCSAPIIMGRQMPCCDPEKAALTPQPEKEGKE